MAVNKVIINGQTKIDLSEDTATANSVLIGETFHDQAGEPQVGTYDPGEQWTAIISISTINPRLYNQSITITKQEE